VDQGDEAVRLRSALEDLVELLEQVGEDGWAGRLRVAQARLGEGDSRGLQDVLDAVGGPGDGGLNDLVIHPLRGHSVEPEDLDEVNQRLGLLTTTSFRLARRLVRQVGRD
jgi:hypothetical protein